MNSECLNLDYRQHVSFLSLKIHVRKTRDDLDNGSALTQA